MFHSIRIVQAKRLSCIATSSLDSHHFIQSILLFQTPINFSNLHKSRKKSMQIMILTKCALCEVSVPVATCWNADQCQHLRRLVRPIYLPTSQPPARKRAFQLFHRPHQSPLNFHLFRFRPPHLSYNPPSSLLGYQP